MNSFIAGYLQKAAQFGLYNAVPTQAEINKATQPLQDAYDAAKPAKISITTSTGKSLNVTKPQAKQEPVKTPAPVIEQPKAEQQTPAQTVDPNSTFLGAAKGIIQNAQTGGVRSAVMDPLPQQTAAK